ncbi:MAG: ferritin family protein [Desulfobacterales bacterium]
MFEIREILDVAIRLELNGEKTYRDAMASSSDTEMNALLAWMADEEARHRQWFAELKARLDRGTANPFFEEMSREVFNDLVGGQSFSLKEVNFAGIESPEQLLSVFREFEQDTVLFYELIEPFIEDPDTRAQLRQIIAEEKRHIEHLSEFRPAVLVKS